MKIYFKIILLVLALAMPGCAPAERDNENDPKSASYRISADVTPGNLETISAHEDIVIHFTDAMNTASVVLGGTLLQSNIQPITDPAVWSSTNFTNDTLTIRMKDSPASWKVLWPKGSGQQLTVEGTTAEGKPMSEVTVTYNVAYSVYVSSTTGGASPSYNGTRAKPFNSIQNGINLAQSLKSGTAYSSETAEVYVSQGTYQSNYYSTSIPVINMVEGISVYGGYSPANWTRNITLYETVLEDTSTTGGGSRTVANRAVLIGSGITAVTVLDGFKIKTANLGHSAGIFSDSSSSVISNNTIIGSAYNDGSGDIYGIIGNNASPAINNNIIFLEWNNNKALNSYAVHLSGSGTPAVTGCSIYGGRAVITTGIYAGTGGTINGNTIYANSSGTFSGNTNSYGILIITASPSIEENLRIDCGRGSTLAACIRINGTSTPSINGNILSNLALNTDTALGVYEASAGSDPSSVTGNDFDGFFGGSYTNTAYYFDENANLITNLTTSIVNGTTNTLTGWSNVTTFTSN